jgi:hypothetical protein
MRPILFPFDTDNEDNNQSPTTMWEGLDPLEMAMKIAMLANEKSKSQSTPTLINRRSLPSLTIDTTFLSSETPDVPTLPKRIHKMPPEEHDSTERKYIEIPEHNEIKSKLNEKRGRTVSYDYPEVPKQSSKHIGGGWDPTFLLKHNLDRTAARSVVQELIALARKFESLESYEECIPSYERVRVRVMEEWKLIGKSTASYDEKRQCFEQLYDSAIEEMKALLDMAVRINHEIVDERDDGNRSEEEMPTPTRNLLRIVRGEPSKKDFTESMNNWLKENWENPYPDEGVVAEIAEMNGTSSTVVSNWLINARTRKWRPAIIKAYRHGSSMETLRGDSIDIFDDKPLKVNVVSPDSDDFSE